MYSHPFSVFYFQLASLGPIGLPLGPSWGPLGPVGFSLAPVWTHLVNWDAIGLRSGSHEFHFGACWTNLNPIGPIRVQFQPNLVYYIAFYILGAHFSLCLYLSLSLFLSLSLSLYIYTYCWMYTGASVIYIYIYIYIYICVLHMCVLVHKQMQNQATSMLLGLESVFL